MTLSLSADFGEKIFSYLPGVRYGIRSGFAILARGDALRWGDFLPDEKVTKESLRAFPPKDLPGVPGWECVKAMFGPLVLLWLLTLPPHQASLGSWPYGWVLFMSGPTMEKRRSRRRQPGPRQLGTAAYQGEALAIEVPSRRGAGTTHRMSMPSM